MRTIALLLAASAAVPASAAIVTIAPNVDLSALPSGYTVNLGGSGEASYTFSSINPYLGDNRTIAVTAGGTGEVFSQFNGNPVALQIGTLVPDQLSLGSFQQPTAAPVDFSIANDWLALQFTLAGSTYNGFAHLFGENFVGLAYNDTPGGSITTADLTPAAPSAAPEPASWAMFIGGFGLVGGAMRRRRTSISFA